MSGVGHDVCLQGPRGPSEPLPKVAHVVDSILGELLGHVCKLLSLKLLVCSCVWTQRQSFHTKWKIQHPLRSIHLEDALVHRHHRPEVAMLVGEAEDGVD